MVILVIFMLAALLGALLLSAALVVWLLESLVPLYAALFVVGVVCTVVAGLVYRLAIKGVLDRWQQRLDVVCKIGCALDTVYRRTVAMLGKLFKRE